MSLSVTCVHVEYGKISESAVIRLSHLFLDSAGIACCVYVSLCSDALCSNFCVCFIFFSVWVLLVLKFILIAADDVFVGSTKL